MLVGNRSGLTPRLLLDGVDFSFGDVWNGVGKSLGSVYESMQKGGIDNRSRLLASTPIQL